jgi:hypothetical protein
MPYRPASTARRGLHAPGQRVLPHRMYSQLFVICQWDNRTSSVSLTEVSVAASAVSLDNSA